MSWWSTVSSWLAPLEGLLRFRTDKDERDELAALRLAVPRLALFCIFLGVIYGFFMGWYAVSLRSEEGSLEGWLQLLAGMIKLPLVFLGTLLVTFPSLYVFSAIAGAQLAFEETLRVLLSAVVVTLTVAASLGTILGFFTLSTTSYPFMVVLNVLLLGTAGSIGLGYLRRTLGRATDLRESGAARSIFRTWTFVFALVGMQMGWILRPFIGHPAEAFSLFRAQRANFFVGIVENLLALLR